jgi:hypothetical protein
MRKLLLIVCIVTLCSLNAWTQQLHTARVTGGVMEKETHQPLVNASVTLLFAKDSTRAAFTFTDRQGRFVMPGIAAGTYKIYITYLGYKALLQPVQVAPADTLIELGSLHLQQTGVNLRAIEIIEPRFPLVMKKDTLEFNAGYYKTWENALMEELLRKLPGIQVDRNGAITVNGTPVNRLFIDGKPFLGNDVRLAIQSLPADMVNRIQLIDRKSDEAQFTGIEDGQREKVINITVRQDHRQQFFGKVAAGYGTDQRYEGNGNLNRFGDGEQLSFIGSADNINNPAFLDGGQAPKSNGINKAWNAGANYSKDFGKKWSLSSSYTAKADRIENRMISARQNILPDTTFYYNQNSRTQDNTTNHAANARLAFQPDSMHMLTIEGNYSQTLGNSNLQNSYESLSSTRQLANYGDVHNSLHSTMPVLGMAASFSKRFKKKGQSLIVNIRAGNVNNRQKGFNRSGSIFIQPGGDTLEDTINQYNSRGNRQRVSQLYLIYTMPVFKSYYLQLMYLHSRMHNTADKYTFDYNPGKKAYDILNDSLSNVFENTSRSHYTTLTLQTQREKYDFSLGATLYLNTLHSNVSGQPPLIKHGSRLYPKVFFNYTFTNNKKLHIVYMGTPEVPGAQQLQPVPDNSNPLYIQLGNPGLRMWLTHRVQIQYEALNPATMRTFSVNANTQVDAGKIINASWYDSLGRQINQPVNVYGAYNTTINISNSFPLKKMQTAINTNTAFNYARDIGYVNGEKGYTHNLGVHQTIGFNYTHKTLWDLGVNGDFSYNGVRYSLLRDNNTNFFNYAFSLNGGLHLPLGLSIYADFSYALNAGLAAGYNQDIALLNAYVAKTLAHNKAVLKLHGFDLLGRNVAVMRNVGQNYIEDTQNAVLQRFFMCSFTWFIKPAKEQ